jgi:hypothetical protein
VKELITQLLENIKSDLIQDQTKKGITASGKSAASLEVRTFSDGSGGQLFGSSSFFYQIFGRGPGGFPPIENIKQWILDKRITVEGSINSFAYLIARKISLFGTAIFRGERKGIEFDKIVESNYKVFEHDLKDLVAEQLRKEIWD